ncbi:hypothetical protein PRIPAC_85201, partial [Pristionchus pacificus]
QTMPKPTRPKGPRRTQDEGEKRNRALLQGRANKKAAHLKSKGTIATVEQVVAKYKDLSGTDFTSCESFRDFPLSDQTIKGLGEAEFTCPTEIQRDSLAFSLTGVDLVAAAKTGSGKTLALVIPLLECLWRQRWSKGDGLGALVISPTRELARQTFDIINEVGKHHGFSCCLLIGQGNDVNFEKRRLHVMNIIVCTPGRLLQHLDENEMFQCDNMQMLVMDEADRILDMGFTKQINAIVESLPRERQTLLFSATQTNNVKQLARVCTKDPVMVSVHEKSAHATPEELKQCYLVCKEEEKVNLLWSFIQHHKHKKTLVFVSSCGQARFLTEAFCHLRPGTSLMGLWGTMKQNKRIEVCDVFERRQKACLIATDVASRGLDFTGVDWVVQMDAPATIDDYIHRVGRTARMNKSGSALLFLSERQVPTMKKMLTERKIPIQETKHDPTRMTDIKLKMQGVLAAFPELNQFAQKYVVSYLRSVYLMSNKNIFDVDSIDAKALAESLGLAAIKRIRFLQKRKEGKKLIVSAKKVYEGHEFGEESDDGEEKDEDEGLFTVKKKDVFNVAEEVKKEQATRAAAEEKAKSARVITKIKEAKSQLKKGIPLNQKISFDEDGAKKEGGIGEGRAKGLDLEKAIEGMAEQDKTDKKEMRERQKAARKEKKMKEKEKEEKKRKRKMGEDDEMDVRIGGDSDEEGSVDISWLPDPDKKREESSDGEEEEGQEQGEEGGREWESGGDSEDEEAMEREFGGRRGGRAVCGSSSEDDEPVPPPAKKRATNKKKREDAESAALALLAAKFK